MAQAIRRFTGIVLITYANHEYGWIGRLRGLSSRKDVQSPILKIERRNIASRGIGQDESSLLPSPRKTCATLVTARACCQTIPSKCFSGGKEASGNSDFQATFADAAAPKPFDTEHFPVFRRGPGRGRGRDESGTITITSPVRRT